jgi:hypothetical protein
MRRVTLLLVLVAAFGGACGGSGATGVPGGALGTVPGIGATSTAPAIAPGTTAATLPSAATATAAATATSADGAPGSPVACSLITQAEAAAALGYPVAAGVAPVAGENTCVFSGPVMKLNSVQVAVVAPAEFLPDRASVAGSFTITPTSGIGDVAYYEKIFLPNTGGESSIQLSVKKGATIFVINVLDHARGDAFLMAAEKTLALAAATRA